MPPRSRSSAFLLLSMLSASLLTGCGRSTLPVRDATAMASRTALTHERFGACWPGEPDRTAIADPVPPPQPGEFTGGFDNHVIRGESCHTQHSFAYSGAFRFDVSDLRGKAIASARLSLERRDTPVEISVERPVPTGVVEEPGCQLLVETATEDWRPGASEGGFASRPIPVSRPVTVEQQPGVVRVSVGVTRAVQQWALGRQPNFGFVVKPKPDAIDKNENSCTGYWFNPQLEITVQRGAGG